MTVADIDGLPIEGVATSPSGHLLRYATWGPESGKVVFSLHGTPGCRLLSRRVQGLGFVALLIELHIRLVTYDRPGYGGSDRQHGRSVADAAADTAAVADALGIERFAVEGTSSGSAHALAVASLLRGRVRRVACVAPLAPYDRLGPALWSYGQDVGLRYYVHAFLREGEAAEHLLHAAEEWIRATSLERDRPDVEEWTKQGVAGWLDDALALLRPWGFDPARVNVPTAIWYDPDDALLPGQHAFWLHRRISNAVLHTTTTLGHSAAGDPVPDWRRLYGWLAGRRQRARWSGS